MREIVLDVETTGLWVNAGHRVIEIACIELEKYQPTGRIFHRYVNPLLAKMPSEAFEVHGIPIEFLWRHAPFHIIADSLLEFIGPDRLIIHNAKFDLGFLNRELELAGRPPLPSPYVDTLAEARKLYPGASNSLDALCRRFGLDLLARQKHGAMIDCALLATVYFELIGGRQPLFDMPIISREQTYEIKPIIRPIMAPRPHPPLSAQELENFQTTLGLIQSPIWIFNPNTKPRLVGLDSEIPF